MNYEEIEKEFDETFRNVGWHPENKERVLDFLREKLQQAEQWGRHALAHEALALMNREIEDGTDFVEVIAQATRLLGHAAMEAEAAKRPSSKEDPIKHEVWGCMCHECNPSSSKEV
jgi:hypothetical protein